MLLRAIAVLLSLATAVAAQTKRADTVAVDLAWGVLNEALAGDDPLTRAQAISALAIAGPRPRVLSSLDGALSDPEPTVRQAAVATLGEMHSRRLLPRLRRALDDEAPEVSFTAAVALWNLGDRRGREIFQDVLTGERATASGGGLRQGIRGRLRGVTRTLRNPEDLARFGMKRAAGIFLGPFAYGITALEELTRDRGGEARAVAVSMLAEDRSRSSLVELEAALGDRNWVVRAAACRALARRDHRRAVTMLEARLADDRPEVRYAAAAAILRLSR